MNRVVPISYKTTMDDRLRVALDAMPVAVAWTRLEDGRVEFMNQRFVDLFGYEQSEFGTVYDFIRSTFHDRAQAQRALDLIGGAADQNLLEQFDLPAVEVPAVRKDGTRICTSFGGVILPDANMTLATFVDISVAKEREQMLHRLAEEDALTGLFNRRSFDSALAGVMSNGTSRFSLLMLDLDGFKAVNDTAGHDCGDRVLKHFAETMKACFRSGDIMARWGGDEFAVLLMPPASADDIRSAVKRLKAALEEPLVLDGKPHRVGVSAGWATFPDDADTLHDLYCRADTTMYEAKRTGRATRPWEAPVR